MAASWSRKGSSGDGLSSRSKNLDSVGEPCTEDDFRQLAVTVDTVPASLGGFRELEDHGRCGLVRNILLSAPCGDARLQRSFL